MDYYKIKIENKDFVELPIEITMGGTRRKKVVFDKESKKLAFFKYQRSNYSTENCSEKLAYEIACILGYDCAKIELGYDKTGEIGVLNYFFENHIYFKSIDLYLHTDEHQNRNEFYELNFIISVLNRIDYKLLPNFIKISVFDALIGEQDRHEENWGIIQKNKLIKLAPLYDNGDSLLRDFGNDDFAVKYYDGIKQFDNYILNSKTQFFLPNKNKKYKHFELIHELLNIDKKNTINEIKNLKKLTNDYIKGIVIKIPNECIKKQHKEFLILYLIKRRDKLLEMI